MTHWFRFEETSGTRENSFPTNPGVEPLTAVGSVGYAAGIKGNAVSFTGSNSLQIAGPNGYSYGGSGSNLMGIAVWVYPAPGGVVLSTGDVGPIDRSWSLEVGAGTATFTVYDDFGGTVQKTSATSIPSNAWSFIVCAINGPGNEIAISVNAGNYETASLVSFNISAEPGKFKVGTNAEEDASFTGRVDEFAFKTSMFTDDEIDCMYNGGLGRTYTGGLVQ